MTSDPVNAPAKPKKMHIWVWFAGLPLIHFLVAVIATNLLRHAILINYLDPSLPKETLQSHELVYQCSCVFACGLISSIIWVRYAPFSRVISAVISTLTYATICGTFIWFDAFDVWHGPQTLIGQRATSVSILACSLITILVSAGPDRGAIYRGKG